MKSTLLGRKCGTTCLSSALPNCTVGSIQVSAPSCDRRLGSTALALSNQSSCKSTVGHVANE